MGEPPARSAGGGRGRPPVLIVHGGAGRIPEEERPAHLRGLRAALEAGWKILAGGGSALDAVEAAVRVLEDDPAFDAGVGAVLRLDGSIGLDASIMEGRGLRAGAVAAVTRVRHPISLARAVLERTPHVFMVGAGAEAIGRRAGLEFVEPDFFVTERERRRLMEILARRDAEGRAAASGEGTGTVGAAALDARGRTAAATSTGGAPGSLPGRVGDSPVIGAGTYADDRAGAVSVTGQGEPILRVLLAREVCRLMGAGVPAAEAAVRGLEYLRAETGGTGGVIAVDRTGGCGAGFTTLWMGSLSRTGPPGDD